MTVHIRDVVPVAAGDCVGGHSEQLRNSVCPPSAAAFLPRGGRPMPHAHQWLDLRPLVRNAPRVLFTAALFVLPLSTARPEALHRLKGPEIRQLFTGKGLTDGTHWKETYAASGKLTAGEMGHDAMNGSWHVDGDRLCK